MGIGDPTGGSPTADFGNPRPPILCSGELRSLTMGPCEALVGCLGQLRIFGFHTEHPQWCSVYVYDPAHQHWMKKSQNMLVWLMTMVLPLHI
jgi:hypothetical protein